MADPSILLLNWYEEECSFLVYVDYILITVNRDCLLRDISSKIRDQFEVLVEPKFNTFLGFTVIGVASTVPETTSLSLSVQFQLDTCRDGNCSKVMSTSWYC